MIKEVKVISHIIIDGYNLIGIHHDDLKRHREKIIELLIEYRKIKGHDITVVFDGWKSGSHMEEMYVTGGIKVIYSRLGEKADNVIKRIIFREKREWIVISSDRDIGAFAWSCGSVPVLSEEFYLILEKAGEFLTGEYSPLENNDFTENKKGNPRKLSKKDKTLMRVLRKL